MSKNFYAIGEENEKEESINNYKDLFKEYKNSPPSLEDALLHMFISCGLSEEKANQYKKQIIDDSEETIKEKGTEKKLKKAIKEKYPNITFKEAKIISSYTCECEDRKYSPYKLLNNNLVSENKKEGIKRVSKYFYILLTTLRKLPRYFLDEKTKYLHRCITTKVSQKMILLNPNLSLMLETQIIQKEQKRFGLLYQPLQD